MTQYTHIDKLELGSGPYPRPGYVHLDIDPNAPDVDIVADASKIIPLPDNSVNELLAINIIEHIEWSSIRSALREWGRIVRPGGTIKIHTVDFTGVVPLLTTEDPNWNKGIGKQPWNGNTDKWEYINHLVMSTNARYNMHRSVFTKPFMEQLLREVGFSQFTYLPCSKNMLYIQGIKL